MSSKLDFYLFLMYLSAPIYLLILKPTAMRNLIVSIVFSLVSLSIIAQGCLPDGITFNTQAQIDNFQTENPGCTEIEGNVIIEESDIINLNGLSVLTSIGGSLVVYGNNDLTNFTGLEGLTTIGNCLEIFRNDSLTSLSGLEGLTTIGGYLSIGYNDWGFPGNQSLTSLEGLSNLTSVGTTLLVLGNPCLTSLSGLDNITSIQNIFIFGNNSLSACEVQSICDYLVIPNGNINIYDNAPGCNSPEEVEEACLSHCLPEGIQFTTQTQIDSFAINNPGCTEIEGDVFIGAWEPMSNISNLNGLNVLTSIGGNLNIEYNDALSSLTGLGNLTSIGGYLKLFGNDSLTSLTSLESLTYVEGLTIGINDLLTSLEGLENITNIQGDIIFGETFTGGSWGTNLSSLQGLENIEYIGGTLQIANCSSLINLSGLNSLNFLGNLRISACDSLANLTGIENLTFIQGDLTIAGGMFNFNPSLTSLTGLENLMMVGGAITIYHNAALTSITGLDNLTSVGGYVWIDHNATLTSLTGLDNLISVGGSLGIEYNSSILDLTGLENLSSIGGDLKITHNQGLSSLSGLDALDSVEGLLIIGSNENLTSLAGLDNVTSIGGSLSVYGNYALTSLTGLEGLTSIAGGLYVSFNDALTSLAGLDNIEAASIDSLFIHDNPFLSTCEVQSVCDYLIAPSGTTEIHDNALGCNTQEEVEEACASSINEIGELIGLSASPNPFATSTTLSYELLQPEKVSLTIYNHLGQLIYQEEENQPKGKQQLIWNAERYADGIYYYRLKVSDAVANGKLVKVRK